MPQEDIQHAANCHYASRFDEEMETMIAIATGNYEEDFAVDPDDDDEVMDQDTAMERLQEMPLCFEKILTDHRNETIQWEILLGTGGPADRVLVTTSLEGHVESAVYEHQDWFQPWTAAENQDATLVESFAQIVGYYEPEPTTPDPYR
jgi:hypothetical protein